MAHWWESEFFVPNGKFARLLTRDVAGSEPKKREKNPTTTVLLELREIKEQVRALRAARAERTAVPVQEAADLLGVGRATVFQLLRDGRLRRPRGRPGRKTLVTVESIRVLLDTPKR